MYKKKKEISKYKDPCPPFLAFIEELFYFSTMRNVFKTHSFKHKLSLYVSQELFFVFLLFSGILRQGLSTECCLSWNSLFRSIKDLHYKLTDFLNLRPDYKMHKHSPRNDVIYQNVIFLIWETLNQNIFIIPLT